MIEERKHVASRKSTASSRSKIVQSYAGRVPKDADGLPRTIFAQASPRSVGGRSLFSMGTVSTAQATDVMSEPSLIVAAAAQLQTAGFSLLGISSTTINIAGPANLYRSAFECSLTTEERPVLKEQAREDTASFVECPETDIPGLIDTAGTPFANLLEGVALEEPRYFMATSPFAPPVNYWHLDVPGGVSLGCNADKAHRGRTTGSGIRVVMVDSGHFAHPYFAARGYRIGPVVLGPGAADPAADESGHGTAESANLFAIAPDVDFTMVKVNFVNSVGAFNTAVGLNPHIISCSWGSDKQRLPLSAADNALAAAVAVAVASGIVVVFSAGNGHYGFPGQHPDVISAGGVFMDATGALRASDYASGFASEIYPGRSVPDLSGLVGMRPRAVYIMLPLEPADEIDEDLGNGQAHPNGDETDADDGWAAISGTSAAAPQLAATAALVRQAGPQLTPAGVRDVLMSSASDVTVGSCHPRINNAAAVGPDLATGSGLVDAARAVLIAKLRSQGAPAHSVSPPSPVGSTKPIVPVTQPISSLAGHVAEPEFERIPLSSEDVAQLEEILRDYPQR